MSKKLGIYHGNSLLGVIGEKSDCVAKVDYGGYIKHERLCIGDVIAFERDGNIYIKTALENGVFGFGSNNFRFHNINKILSYKNLTVDILRKIQGVGIDDIKEQFDIREIKESKPVEMTVKEIEKVLGKKIKIIGD